VQHVHVIARKIRVEAVVLPSRHRDVVVGHALIGRVLRHPLVVAAYIPAVVLDDDSEPFYLADALLDVLHLRHRWPSGRSGKEVRSPPPPPLGTGRAPFRRIRLEHRPTSLRDTNGRGSAVPRHPITRRGCPIGLGSNLGVTT